MGDAKSIDQDIGHESLGRNQGEHAVEAQDEHEIDAESLDLPSLDSEGGEPEGRRIRLEHHAGMGLECQDRGRRALAHAPGEFGRDHACRLDDGAVTEVNPVEIAERHHRAARTVGQACVMAE
jgi:hypothetical protein